MLTPNEHNSTFIERRRSKYLTLLGIVLWVLVLITWYRPRTPATDLTHLAASRQLRDYVARNVQPLAEPPPTLVCARPAPLVALVPSSPARLRRRAALRTTWAGSIETYFVMGLIGGRDRDEQLQMYRMELKSHEDIVVFDFVDSYSNLTLKIALMLQWAEARCPGAAWVMKVDDDVLVNPWILGKVLEDRKGDDLIGIKYTNKPAIRDPYDKWYLPRWLYAEDTIPEYLTGAAYLIKADKLQQINEAAYSVPLINIEDIFFTYLVAKRSLGLNLTHEARFSVKRPAVRLGCTYWPYATVHSMLPEQIEDIWPSLLAVAADYLEGRTVCQWYRKYFFFHGYDRLMAA